MIKILRQWSVHEIFRFIITLLSVKYAALKTHSLLFTGKSHLAFSLEESRQIGPDSSPPRKADDTPSPALPRARSGLPRLHPWTPWIWGILSFRSIKVTVRP
jgi:hypothetical protein